MWSDCCRVGRLRVRVLRRGTHAAAAAHIKKSAAPARATEKVCICSKMEHCCQGVL